MKIFVKVKAGAKNEKITQTGEKCYDVSVKAPPIEGKANSAVEKLLAKRFGVSASRVKVLSGKTSKQKIAEIS